MAIDVCDLVLKRGRVSKVTVYLEKPSAIRFAQSSGVRITRMHPSYNKLIEPPHVADNNAALSVNPRNVVAYIGIGTNLGDRVKKIHQAIRLLQAKGVKLLDTSFLYETAPMYVLDQPSFLNACLKVGFCMTRFRLTQIGTIFLLEKRYRL